jgi:hypothetical protein
MGIVPLFFASVLATQAPIEAIVKPRVISVSMFKNGYAFVTREIPITDNSAKVVEVPTTSLGSLWFWTNEGQVDSVTGVDERTPASMTIPFGSSDEILKANIGKKFLFNMLYRDEKDGKVTDRRQSVEGILKTFANDMIAVETPEGTFMLSRSKVDSVIAKDPLVVLTQEQKYEQSAHHYKIVTKNNAKSVMMMSLERGMTWAPGYAIDLSSPEKLIFTAKSTVLNDLLDFDNAKLRLITGFPNIQFQGILDPLTSGMSVDDWLRSISGGAPGGMQNGMGGQGGGGFSNVGGRGGELTRKSAAKEITSGLDVVSFDPSDVSLIVGNASGEQLEDLFFYDLEKVSLKKGSRSYQYLYQFETPYKRTYSWDGVKGSPIFNKIKFKNMTGKPISTAAASMFKKGEVVGQGMMNYTAANTEAELTVSRSLDFTTDSNTELLDRAVGAMKDKKGVAVMDLITYETELEVTNPKPEEVSFQIKLPIQGEVLKTEPKAENEIAKTGIRGQNPSNSLKWEFKLESGKSAKFTVRYKVYVPTGQ